MKNTQGVLSDEDLETMQRRNLERAQALVKRLGTHYAGHPRSTLRYQPANPVLRVQEGRVR